MGLQLYSLASVVLNGLLLTQESSVTVDRDPRLQEVETVAIGFAGVSQGAGIVRVEVENAVPAVGFEVNPGQFFFPQPQVVELVIFGPSVALTLGGFVIKDNFRHGVNTPARIGFSFIGKPGDWL